jgi:hypothetical protein
MFTDPTGHKCNPDDGCNERPDFFAQSENTDEPDPLNMDILSDKAKDLYSLYLRMYANKSGWWWDVYGSGGFTIWEFMAKH